MADNIERVPWANWDRDSPPSSFITDMDDDWVLTPQREQMPEIGTIRTPAAIITRSKTLPPGASRLDPEVNQPIRSNVFVGCSAAVSNNRQTIGSFARGEKEDADVAFGHFQSDSENSAEEYTAHYYYYDSMDDEEQELTPSNNHMQSTAAEPNYKQMLDETIEKYAAEIIEKDGEVARAIEVADSAQANVVLLEREIGEANCRLSQITSALQCSICLETFLRPHTLTCGHIFCQECLVQWLLQNMRCPTCRADVILRPAIAFAIQEVIGCLDLDQATDSSNGPSHDPWDQLFSQQGQTEERPRIFNHSQRVRTPRSVTYCRNCSLPLLDGMCMRCDYPDSAGHRDHIPLLEGLDSLRESLLDLQVAGIQRISGNHAGTARASRDYIERLGLNSGTARLSPQNTNVHPAYQQQQQQLHRTRRERRRHDPLTEVGPDTGGELEDTTLNQRRSRGLTSAQANVAALRQRQMEVRSQHEGRLMNSLFADVLSTDEDGYGIWTPRIAMTRDERQPPAQRQTPNSSFVAGTSASSGPARTPIRISRIMSNNNNNNRNRSPTPLPGTFRNRPTASVQTPTPSPRVNWNSPSAPLREAYITGRSRERSSRGRQILDYPSDLDSDNELNELLSQLENLAPGRENGQR